MFISPENRSKSGLHESVMRTESVLDIKSTFRGAVNKQLNVAQRPLVTHFHSPLSFEDKILSNLIRFRLGGAL